jgi:hypothetical protein
MLSANVATALFLSERLRHQCRYAEKDEERWKREFEVFSKQDHPWPFTHTIDRVALTLRWVKALVPVLAGVLLIIGGILK